MISHQKQERPEVNETTSLKHQKGKLSNQNSKYKKNTQKLGQMRILDT